MDIRTIKLETVDSTNNYAKKIFDSLETEKTVIIANEQTNGRGRQGRSFHSPKDNGIYMSIVLKKECKLEALNMLTVISAVAVSKAIYNITKLNNEIKWVNDIYINLKKVCGILAESVNIKSNGLTDGVIVGIGINIKTTDDFPKDIKDIAGALNFDDRDSLIYEILKQFDVCLKEDINSILNYYRDKSMVLNKNITYEKNGVTFTKKVVEINNSGNLVVCDESGKSEIITSGEIRLGVNNICG